MQRQLRECGIHRFSTAHIRGSRLPRLRRQVPPHGGHLGTTKNAATLKKAVSKAPSGLLYQDLSTLQSDVQTSAAQGGSLGQAREGITVDAYAVEQYRLSVNPSS